MSSRSNFEKLRASPTFRSCIIVSGFYGPRGPVHLKSHRKSTTSGPVLVARLKFLGEITI